MNARHTWENLLKKYKSRSPQQKRRFRWGAGIFLFLVVLVVVFRLCGPAPIPHVNTALPVVLAPATTMDVPVYINALGTVTPVQSVTVKTQVDGQLLTVLFDDGQMVKEGDLLAEIDPRPFEAQLLQYQGQLQRDQALLENARRDLQRFQTLWSQDAISQQTLATQESLVAQYEGAVKIDEGLIKATQVNLAYCKIVSPLSGKAGISLVDEGNFIQTSDPTGLVIINSLDPMTVVFPIAEDNIPRVLQKQQPKKPMTVLAYDRQQKNLLSTGTLSAIDSQIDVSTGTVNLRADFPNGKNQLFPNQFVNVRLLIETIENATIIPVSAIQYGPKNTFVYLKNENHTVSVHPVVVGVTEGDNAVVTGLTPGQLVVVEGTDRLVDGSHIREMKSL
jgi:multidrug efflux system membrane fusion protein